MKSNHLIIILAIALTGSMHAVNLANTAKKMQTQAQTAADKAQNAAQQTAESTQQRINITLQQARYNSLSPEQQLIKSVEEDNLAEVKRLLNAGVDVNTKNNDGIPVLWLSKWRGHNNMLEVLLTHGADINAKNKQGQTLLMLVDKPPLIPRLIKLGADVNAKDNGGKTVLEYFQDATVEARQLLIDAGAKRAADIP